MGIYSPRPGTYAAKKYEDNIPLEVKKQRRSRLNELLITMSSSNNLVEVGTQREIVIRTKQENVLIGYTDNMKNMIVHTTPEQFADARIGEFMPVQVLRTEAFKLFGDLTAVSS